MSTYTVIGTRPIRHDGADKVTGRAQYGADYTAAGLLHGFILRSPHAHARILRIDTSKASAFPGVRAVMTAADLPEAADRMRKNPVFFLHSPARVRILRLGNRNS